MNWRNVIKENPQTVEIRELQHDLCLALDLLATTLPSPIQTILRSYCDVVSVDESHRWLYDLAEAIIPFAQAAPRGPYDLVDRAPCPLCGGLPLSFYGHSDGFVVPAGLSAHLRGHGNAHQCVVTRLFHGEARRDWAERFGGPAGSVGRGLYEERMEKRRSKELQYLIHPYRSARLIDEGRFLGKQREPAGMAWAEARLKDLGFRKVIDRKVVSFTREYPRAVVYADLRNEGGLHFVIAPKPLDLNAQRWEVWSRPVETYRMPDRLKKDLLKKLDEVVEAAVPPTPPRPVAQILKFERASEVGGKTVD